MGSGFKSENFYHIFFKIVFVKTKWEEVDQNDICPYSLQFLQNFRKNMTEICNRNFNFAFALGLNVNLVLSILTNFPFKCVCGCLLQTLFLPQI